MDEAQTARRAEILQTALGLLLQGGPAALTTAALAREARCSKQTLYALFEDRDAILAAVLAQRGERAPAAREPLPEASPEALAAAAADWLEQATSDETLALHRAALSDASGGLSRVLAGNRDPQARRVRRLLEALRDKGLLAFDDGGEALRLFQALLIGERPLLALHGVAEARPKRKRREKLAQQAVELLQRLYAPAPKRPAKNGPAPKRPAKNSSAKKSSAKKR